MSHTLYQQMIIDHSKKPRGLTKDLSGCCVKGNNPLCGDWLNVCVDIKDGKIENIIFDGDGCSISMAAASVLVDVVKGMPAEDFFALKNDYIAMLHGEEKSLPEKLKIFSGVAKYPMRVKCASFAWHALEQSIHKHNYPLLVSIEVERYWEELIKTQHGIGISLDFKQVGCYGWQFMPKIVNKEPSGKKFCYGNVNIWIEEALIPKIQGTKVVHVEKTLGQKKVEFIHPRAKQKCGCGESFELEDE